MPKRNSPKNMECCETEPMLKGMKCCQVDALITIDGRGQIVLPKDVREKAKVKAGDKFVIISYESNGEVCCLFLVKADDFGKSVKSMLGPMMEEILK
ncbi:HgcAB-associated protein HgcC [Chloroflexota bacterium]